MLEEKHKVYRSVGKNLLKMLAPNWENHDASTNTIINYFPNRQHTEKFLKTSQKKSLPKVVSTVKYAKTAESIKSTEMNSKNKVFGHLTNK